MSAFFTKHAPSVRLGFLVALALSAAPNAAHATTSIACNSAEGEQVEIDILIGTLPVLNVLSATIEADGQIWSTDASLGTPISFGQGILDDRQTIIDFTDSNIEQIVASLRIFSGFEGQSAAQAGVLVFPGLASHAVVCAS